MLPLPPPEYTAKQCVLTAVGNVFDTRTCRETGLPAVSLVESGSEFAVRSEVVDIMPHVEENASRMVLDADR
jgi:transcription-repair coupling factor (superfamily II helicase)